MKLNICGIHVNNLWPELESNDILKLYFSLINNIFH